MTITESFIRYDQELLAQGKSLKTRKNYRSTLNCLIRALGDVPVELVSYDQITRWKLLMQSSGYQPSYIKSNLCKLREVYKFLRLQGFKVIDSRDIDLPSIPQKAPVWLDSSEVGELLEVIDNPRDKALVAALWGTGARVSELLQLNRDSIIDGCASIVGKNDKAGVLYFDALSLKLIDTYLDTRKDQLRPLFVSGQYRRITVSRVEQLLHVYQDKAGLDKNITPHTLRRSFASDMIANGADIYTVSKQLRHSQISTTVSSYAFMRDKQNRENHAKYHSPLR